MIRVQTKEDYQIVQAMTRQAFWNLYQPGANEHFLLHNIRKSKDFIPQLSLLLEEENQIVAHIAYSHSKVTYDSKKILPTVTFGPVSVLHQNNQKELVPSSLIIQYKKQRIWDLRQSLQWVILLTMKDSDLDVQNRLIFAQGTLSSIRELCFCSYKKDIQHQIKNWESSNSPINSMSIVRSFKSSRKSFHSRKNSRLQVKNSFKSFQDCNGMSNYPQMRKIVTTEKRQYDFQNFLQKSSYYWMFLGYQLLNNCFYMLPEIKGPQRPSKKQMTAMNHTESFHSSNYPERRAQIREKNLRDVNQREVILISAEQEDRESFQSSIADQRLRYEITRAQLTGNRFNVILAVAKHYLPVPQQEKEAKIREIVLQFFLEKANININFGYFCPRIDSGICAEPGKVYESRFLLFGVDLFTTKKIMSRFARYSPTLKWVDSSHCILEFPSIQIGLEFLQSQILSYEEQKLVPWEQNQNVHARNWLELCSYLEIYFTRRLFVRNLTELDEKCIMSRVQTSESFDKYIRTKMELENALLSSENIKMVMEKVDQDERNMRMMDPNYKNIMKKKRMEQKKIQNLVSERDHSNRGDYGHNQGRSRTRDQARDKRQHYNNYNNYNNGNRDFRRSNEGGYGPRGYSKEYESVAYKGNPKIYPERYNLHKAQNPIPRQRPSYATPEKMNEIRQHLNQRQDLNQSYTSPPPRNANPPSEYEDQLNMSFTRNQMDTQQNILPNEIIETNNPNVQEVIPKRPFQQDSQSLAMSSQPSSSFNHIESQFQKFHINSSDYSSIFERSKHQYSQLQFQDSHQISNSVYLSSNQTSHQHNTSELLFEPELEKYVGIIPHCRERSKIEEQDDEICELLNVSNPNAQKGGESSDLNFQVTKKALNYDDPETRQTQAQKESGSFVGKKKLPKKKNQNKDAPDN